MLKRDPAAKEIVVKKGADEKTEKDTASFSAEYSADPIHFSIRAEYPR